MKTKFLKIISLVVITLISSIALFSCTKLSAQKSITQTVWGNEETFTYKAQYNQNDKQINGILTLSIKRINKEDVQVGTLDVKGFIGTIFVYDLQMEDGSIVKSKSLIDSQNKPIATYTEKNDKIHNSANTFLVNYIEKDKVAVINSNNESFEIKTGKYDKNFFLDNYSVFSILRSTNNSNLLSGFAFKSINPTEKNLTSLFAKATLATDKSPIKTTDKIEAGYKDKNVVSVVSISLQQKTPPPGEAILLYIGESIKLENKTIVNPILQIKEGAMTYILDSAN